MTFADRAYDRIMSVADFQGDHSSFDSNHPTTDAELMTRRPMTGVTSLGATRRARNRSPAHPAFDLKTALERTRIFYDCEHFSWAPLASTLKQWGYGPKSSSGLRTLAALRHFSLLDETGTGRERCFRLSALAQTILLHEGSDTQHQASVSGHHAIPVGK